METSNTITDPPSLLSVCIELRAKQADAAHACYSSTARNYAEALAILSVRLSDLERQHVETQGIGLALMRINAWRMISGLPVLETLSQ